LFKKSISKDIITRAFLIITLSGIYVFISALVLSISEKFSMIQILFEVGSAFGTVGLSTGITPFLSNFGKVIIIMLMFIGKIGPLTILLAVSRYTQCKWLKLYVKRWLEADVILPTGEALVRKQGTPQGGVISPLLANIFLHLVFDKWMQDKHPHVHFERYADDIVVHCRSYKQLKYIESKIKSRFTQCKLELCTEKTKIVYCRNASGNEYNAEKSFDFLGYTFRPRSARNSCDGKLFVSFSPAVSRKALKAMRLKIKQHPLIRGCYSLSIEALAKAINPIIQGWINYYGKFGKASMSAIYRYINDKLQKWARMKYKKLQRRKKRSGKWLRELYLRKPTLFAHWRHWRWVAE